MPSLTPLTMFSIRAGICLRTAGFKFRQVPSIFTVSAITLYRFPPVILPMVTTALSRGLTFRDTMFWSAEITWAEMAMASMPFSGAEPWLLLPFTVMKNRSEEAIMAPLRTATLPTSYWGHTCWPKTPSTWGFSSTPASIIFLAPLAMGSSSAGWKISFTVPSNWSRSSLST